MSENSTSSERRRRAEQLGDLLPDTTNDESADWGDRDSGGAEASRRDEEILRDVPPHH